ncbi:hypothetical protein EIM50_25840, partial [Pseudoxanthomonas sp. SGD-10]
MKEILERCHLCGKREKLTFEHIPPKCAFNTDLIYVQKHEQMLNEKSPTFGKYLRSQKGFGKYCLCPSCNNSTGNWYAKAFCDFIHQGKKIQNENSDFEKVSGTYHIKPKNVLKQILLMFLCADSAGILREKNGVVPYLMDKKSSEFPEKLNIYLYSNNSVHKRMMGYSFAMDCTTGERFQWSEINFNPFGYFMTYDSNPPNNFMVNVSNFNMISYDVQVPVDIVLANLIINN